MSPEELFNEHKHLVKKTLYRLFPDPRGIAKIHSMEVDDLIQYLYTGLWKACLKWDENKGNRQFRTYAITHMRWEILARLRDDNQLITGYTEKANEMRKQGYVSLDSSPKMDGENENRTYHEIIGDKHDIIEDVIGNELSSKIKELFPPRTVEFVKLRLKGLPCREIAQMYGISHQAVDQSIKKYAKKLKKVL